MTKFSTRALFLAIGGISVLLLAAALYMQHVENMPPCPLCVIQRYAFVAIAIFAFTAAGQKPPLRAAVGGLGLIASLTGGGVAIDHLYVLAHPGFSCGIDPMETALNKIFPAVWLPGMFKADGFCSTEYAPLLGLSLPMWALIWFSIFALAFIYLLVKRRK